MRCAQGTDLPRAASLLRGGRLVAFPTETVYGLGAHALDPHAVARVFEAKGRPRFDPLIVHLADSGDLDSLAAAVPEAARELARRFWPGPLTLVLPKKPVVPDLVTAGLPTVAVRVPDHPMAQKLLRAAGVPVAAPSANLFGRLSPTRAQDVLEQLGDRIDYVLDGGPCRVGVESTVVQVTADGDTPQGRGPGTGAVVLRPGGVPVEEIEAVIGPVAWGAAIEEATAAGRASPGMLPQHYAPRTPLVIGHGDAGPHSEGAGRVGLLSLGPVEEPERFAAVEVLSPTCDLTEAAAGFFAALHRLDAAGLDRIVALPFPEERLGRALNDRLRRAAH